MPNPGIVFTELQLPQPERIAMKHAFALVVLACTLLTPAQAAVVHTSSAAFLPQVGGGAYTETFDTALSNAPRALDYAQGDFAYTVFAGRGLFGNGDFLGTSTTASSLTISFTGADVTAFGANFYNTGVDLAFRAAEIIIALSDGTITRFTPSSVEDSYRGFTSDVAIASVTLSSTDLLDFASLDNLTVGAWIGEAPGEVPEPASLGLIGIGLAGLLGQRRRASSAN
ncbi:PEP-CTERM sorting domain-containing protein [Massilia arenae]|uniref:PEP-CTERM sorting domain-containing protein n=2 Tax=Massilia arenae TaxID=2603288 RepID=A0A5C7FRT1_9BURK|nr:PEP-CTERM sorting domain-containing protein [Massilia arenae]